MDEIKIHGLKFTAFHGVYEDEKQNGQEFIIDCKFTLDTSTCGDDLSKTIHYGEVSMDIVEFCTKNRFDLLEMLGNGLAKFLLLKYSLMRDITLTIHKPNAPIPTKFDDVTLTIKRGYNDCYLALGSNLGEREENLNSVLCLIEQDENITLLKKSTFIETPPYGVVDQPDFLNGVIKVRTIYTPFELLNFCQNAEKLAKRIKTRVWGERTLDVDILTFENEIIFTDNLKIPHQEMHLRDFVLKPLIEIEPYFIHPVYKKDIKTLLNEVNL